MLSHGIYIVVGKLVFLWLDSEIEQYPLNSFFGIIAEHIVFLSIFGELSDAINRIVGYISRELLSAFLIGLIQIVQLLRNVAI